MVYRTIAGPLLMQCPAKYIHAFTGIQDRKNLLSDPYTTEHLYK